MSMGPRQLGQKRSASAVSAHDAGPMIIAIVRTTYIALVGSPSTLPKVPLEMREVLLDAQSSHGIDLGGATGREEAGNGRDAQK